MAAADSSKSAQHAVESLVLDGLISGAETAQGVVVAVPTIADAEIDEVAVDVASAFSSSVAVGDLVIVAPEEALPTSAILCGAYVSDTDEVTISFAAKEGGAGVTGADADFTVTVIHVR